MVQLDRLAEAVLGLRRVWMQNMQNCLVCSFVVAHMTSALDRRRQSRVVGPTRSKYKPVVGKWFVGRG